jgi:hypothetical protein
MAAPFVMSRNESFHEEKNTASKLLTRSVKPFEGDTSPLTPTEPIPQPGGLPASGPGPGGEESYYNSYSEQDPGSARFGSGGSSGK